MFPSLTGKIETKLRNFTVITEFALGSWDPDSGCTLGVGGGEGSRELLRRGVRE
jgi:hypothetical protein